MPVTSNRLVGEVSVPRKKAPRHWSSTTTTSSDEYRHWRHWDHCDD